MPAPFSYQSPRRQRRECLKHTAAALRVWKDTNVDALPRVAIRRLQGGAAACTEKLDAGELVTLASLGITSISLVRDTQKFMLADGSQSHGYTTFVMNGATRQAADMSLAA